MYHYLNSDQLAALGILSIGFGIYAYYEKRRRLGKWIPTIGSIEDIRRDPEGDVTARIQYVDHAGIKRRCSLPLADGDSVGLGSEIQVSYNPLSPDKVFISDKKDMHLTVIASVTVGILLFVAAFFKARSS